jgi:hypothetical protein
MRVERYTLGSRVAFSSNSLKVNAENVRVIA